MKKRFITCLIVTILLITVGATAVSCKHDKVDTTYFTVKFVCNGGSAIADAKVESGATYIAPLPNPTSTRKYYTFDGWFTDDKFATAFSAEGQAITADITLHAKWTIHEHVFGAPKIVDNTYKSYCECGEVKTETISDGIDYVLNSDNASYSVAKIGKISTTDIVLPATYNNLPVTTIGKDALNENLESRPPLQKITSIIIPATVTKIEEGAFAFCGNLKNVTFEEGSKLAKIGADAFYKCSALESINLNTAETLRIDSRAFYANTSLPSINLPKGLVSIGDSAFYNCKKFESITIPSNVVTIGSGVFENCTNLASATIEKIVPTSSNDRRVTTMGGRVFANCTALTQVFIPSSVKTVGTLLFTKCNNLTKINVGFATLEEIPTTWDEKWNFLPYFGDDPAGVDKYIPIEFTPPTQPLV